MKLLLYLTKHHAMKTYGEFETCIFVFADMGRRVGNSGAAVVGSVHFRTWLLQECWYVTVMT